MTGNNNAEWIEMSSYLSGRFVFFTSNMSKVGLFDRSLHNVD